MSFRNSLFLSVAALAAGETHAAEPVSVARDEIVVTASLVGRSQNETILGTQVIDAEALQRNLENTIGETLRREPGVSSTFFGPGASRPVIRGLGGDRISVLDSGIGSIDASATSPDHAVAVEPATATRIEVVRGASTLLYGSSAAGGVVNVTTGRIPQSLPDDGVDGALRVGGSTADAGASAAGGFDARLFRLGDGAVVFHGEGAYRKAEDYKIPGFEQSTRLREQLIADGETPDGAFGKQRNSGLRTHLGSVGASYVEGDSFAGFSATSTNTNYDVPGVETQPDGSGPSIRLRQRRVDFNSELNRDFLIFRTTRVRVGYGDYTHQEFEADGAPGTIFNNKGVEGRAELVQKTFGGLRGASGVQWKTRDFEAIGDEAFLTPTKTFQWGVFSVQDLQLGKWRLEAGGRFERTRHDNETAGRRELSAVSFSAGVGYKPSEYVFFGVTGLRTQRAPAPEELFSDGAHLATGTFEIGDPTLGLETARGAEATAKFGDEKLALTVNGFYTSYRNFVFERNTGAVQVVDGEALPVIAFTASDATFRGGEAQFEAELAQAAGFDIHGDASVSYVRATSPASATGDLPRIPPLHSIFGLEARSDFADLRGEIEYAARQNRIGDLEVPTDSYVLYNVHLTMRPVKDLKTVALRLSAENLTNEEARTHASFLKDRVPLPGRNIKVSVAASF